MDTSTSSEELDTSIESLSSSVLEAQNLSRDSTSSQRPSPFTLRSQCARFRCPEGTGILFRSRISPSPSKQRVRSRRRRRSDQHRKNTSDLSSLEISYENGHAHLHDHEHLHHHQHHHHQGNGHNHHHHHHQGHDHFPHDGIHNIDHHHVHLQNQQLHAPRRLQSTPKEVTLRHVHEPLRKQVDFRLGDTQGETRQTYLTHADILFDEMQKEEKRRLAALKERKERTVTRNETTTTTVHRTTTGTSSNGGLQATTNATANVGVSSLAESVKNTVIGFLTPQKESTLAAIVESSESGFEDGTVIGDRREKLESNEPFRPAREFFDEVDSRDRFFSEGYFSGSDTPSKLRESTRRLSIRKPYNQYIAYSSDEEFDDWKQQPKSDYTYSASLTYRRRVTPDRKIGSPNMSRRTLKGGTIGYVGSSDFSATEDASNTWDLRSRTVIKPMDALSDTSDGEEAVVDQQLQNRSRRSTRSRSIDFPKSNGSVTRTITTTSMEYTTTKTLHQGLDAESDVDDGADSAIAARPVPLLGRGGTPLGRATTPLATLRSSSRRSSSVSLEGGKGKGYTISGAALDAGKGYTIGGAFDTGKGYKLGEGTIAEEVEEEETQENVFMRWTRKTILCITHATTVVTASVAMVAARALAAPTRTSTEDIREEKSSSSMFTSMKSKYNATCEHLRKNPILIWIPILFILLLLALAAYWWLLQSHGNTAGASDPTENDGPSFLFILLTLLSDLTSWVYSGLSSFVTTVGATTSSSFFWLVSACQGGLLFVVESVKAGFSWLGASTISSLVWLWSLAVSCFSFLVDVLYLIWDYLCYGAFLVYSFFSSSASYVYGFLPFVATSNDSEPDEANVEKESFNIFAWVTNLNPLERLSQAYMAIAEGTQSSGTMLWNAWLWLVLSMGEIISAMASYTLWALSSVWAAILYVLTGLWTVLTYIWLTIVSILWTAATTVRSLAPNKSTTVSTSTEKNIVIQPSVVNVSYPRIEEIVQQVLDSEQLKGLIAAAVAESAEGQLTVDSVTETAKLLIEKELQGVKEDMSALKTEVHGNAAASVEHHSKIIRLQEEKANLIKELGMLGQRLYNVEGKVEVADHKVIDNHREIEENIAQLVQQINKLEGDHANLAADVKSCCDGKRLPILLGEIFGINSGETSETEHSDIGAWLKNYFVARDELDVKLGELMATMKVKTDDDATKAAASQTTDMVMASVLLKLQEEMKKQQLQLSEESQQQMSAQVNSQVKAAAGILGEQVFEQVVQQVQLQNQQLKENLRENVNIAVQEQVSSAVEVAVNKAVESAVNAAVPLAVGKSVPETVNDILPGMVSEEIAASVPEVVASVLPAAVTSAVSEAMVHVSESQAGEDNLEVNKNSVKNEIVGVTGSASVNISHGNGDNLFIPGMHFSGGLNESEVMRIVQDALRKYDADKTGMVDHALESAGGNIISTRCTESYQVHQAEVRVLGFPIYRYSTNNPRTVIQPDTMPGQCWAFKGSQGYIVIQLAGFVRPTGFTLEHIPKSLSPNGAIDSAPHHFEVWGLGNENDDGTFLGKYEYAENSDPLQYFPVTVENSEYFPLIELKINSNHGNLQYTCLYRFRVHGVRLLQ